jgi:hypothetical protein
MVEGKSVPREMSPPLGDSPGDFKSLAAVDAADFFFLAEGMFLSARNSD